MRTAHLPAAPPSTHTLRIVGANVIDGLGHEPRIVDIDVSHGRISSVGMSPAATRADLTIDARGLTLTPGLIDTHVHLTMPNESSEAADRLKFAEEHAFATAQSMRITLEAGITAARDLSGLTPGFRNAVATGMISGPRLHLAITMLSPTGGHADPVRPNGSLPSYVDFEAIPSVATADTDEELIKAVRTVLRTGADLVKLCTTGGISTPADSPEDLGFREHQVRLVVEELKRRGGKPVAAHAQGIEGALNAVRGGATTLEHGYEMTDELVHEMLQRGTVLVPTLSTLKMPPNPQRVSAQAVAKKLEWQVRGEDAARKAIAAGVAVAMGTDAGIHPHGRNGAEFGHLVRAGMTPLHAISACTIQGARVLGLENELGSVEVGKMADLVLWQADPLIDADALSQAHNAAFVIQEGTVVKGAVALDH